MPIWPCVKTTAQQDHLASLLLQVHIDELNCLKQLCVKHCGGMVIEQVIFHTAGVRCIKHLHSSNLTTLLTVCRKAPWQTFTHECGRGSAESSTCMRDMPRLCTAPMRTGPCTLGLYSCSAVPACMLSCGLV